ncbi:CNP1-like family protein [Neisseria leonii]|uniref:CNP1-like family protein n=1 Tax=Neisseria leonii TaxID=2995413 RepID=A0A9X4E0X9_9NEIS|nr:CNP1-like family protein [Neisseria sp. 51.81]MDD9326984.1 CNP1-like family protein [Neisseria sp. 51.81]
MRLLILPVTVAAFAAQAAGINQKDTLYNTNYVESPEEAARSRFSESDEALPALPDGQTRWQRIYVAPGFPSEPSVALDSVRLAADGSIRYVLNVRSQSGYDNISAEAVYCAPTSFRQEKKSSYKIYAFADMQNRHWIQPRNPQWQNIGSILSSPEPVRGALYKVWCIDGVPKNGEGLRARLLERGGKVPASGRIGSNAADR